MQVKFRIAAALLYVLLGLIRAHAGTLATFQTSVGNMELEFYDDDKPVTVSNFVKYVTSGTFTNQFIQRWVPNFVIQGGGYKLTNTTNGLKITSIHPFGTITNEYSVGRTFSNIYGTIAMARGSETNSAGAEWFLNLGNNANLDQVNGGFTVFGHLVAGTNVLNLFVPPPPTNNINLVNLGITPFGEGTPVIGSPVTVQDLFADLIYVDIRLRRDLGLTIHPTRPDQPTLAVTWNTVAGVTNTLQYSSALARGSWVTYTNIIGNGAAHTIIAPSADNERIYRVTLTY